VGGSDFGSLRFWPKKRGSWGRRKQDSGLSGREENSKINRSGGLPLAPRFQMWLFGREPAEGKMWPEVGGRERVAGFFASKKGRTAAVWLGERAETRRCSLICFFLQFRGRLLLGFGRML